MQHTTTKLPEVAALTCLSAIVFFRHDLLDLYVMKTIKRLFQIRCSFINSFILVSSAADSYGNKFSLDYVQKGILNKKIKIIQTILYTRNRYPDIIYSLVLLSILFLTFP